MSIIGIAVAKFQPQITDCLRRHPQRLLSGLQTGTKELQQGLFHLLALLVVKLRVAPGKRFAASQRELKDSQFCKQGMVLAVLTGFFQTITAKSINGLGHA
jgi:hypothetical protein